MDNTNLIERLEHEINKTPSGDLRNLLCDVSIALQSQSITNMPIMSCIDMDDLEAIMGIGHHNRGIIIVGASDEPTPEPNIVDAMRKLSTSMTTTALSMPMIDASIFESKVEQKVRKDRRGKYGRQPSKW